MVAVLPSQLINSLYLVVFRHSSGAVLLTVITGSRASIFRCCDEEGSKSFVATGSLQVRYWCVHAVQPVMPV